MKGKRLIMMGALTFALAAGAHAQTPASLDDILRSVAANNTELRALQSAATAEKAENRSENNLEDPTVDYLRQHNTLDGEHSTEFNAIQSFDFPTQYVTRHRAISLRNEAVDRQYEAARRDVLLQAKELCLQMIFLNRQRTLLDQRLTNAEAMEKHAATRLATGDANILEMNKIKMERMNVNAEKAKNVAEYRTALQQLLALNGNQPLEFDGTDYPAVDASAPLDYNSLHDLALTGDAALEAQAIQTQAAQKQVSVDRQGWLPKLSVGFRRNTTSVDADNGLYVGASVPIFQNRKKVAAAKARAVEARLTQQSEKEKAEAQFQGLYNEMQQLRAALDVYDLPLMFSTLDVLKKAFAEGELSVIEYFTEMECIYQNLMAHGEVEYRYNQLAAELTKNEL
jgi:outer membrane protein TolC